MTYVITHCVDYPCNFWQLTVPPSAVPLVPDLEHWQFPVLTVLTAFATCWTVFHGRKDRDLPEL
jgi:hypothetical protein